MKYSKESVGILGYGEVGMAIAKFYQNPKIRSRNRDDGLENIDILHICIPYSKNFIKTVKSCISEVKPKLTIIHSTVAAGTTKKIGGMIVHSPIRGVHPKLYEGIKTFIKYIGADNKKAAIIAQKHFKSIGIRTKIFYPSATTELGKLLDTTYYGLCIAFHGEMKKICDKMNVEFDQVATEFNTSYNLGYKKLGMPHVMRPVLSPPNPTIGGHCVISNAQILKKKFRSPALDLILKYKPVTNNENK